MIFLMIAYRPLFIVIVSNSAYQPLKPLIASKRSILENGEKVGEIMAVISC